MGTLCYDTVVKVLSNKITVLQDSTRTSGRQQVHDLLVRFSEPMPFHSPEVKKREKVKKKGGGVLIKRL
jgi:hypothetical protein